MVGRMVFEAEGGGRGKLGHGTPHETIQQAWPIVE
jgi:hypothetical protein